MEYNEDITDTVAYGASQSEWKRWRMYGDCLSDEQPEESGAPEVKPDRIPPNLNRFDVSLWHRGLGNQALTGLVRGEES